MNELIGAVLVFAGIGFFAAEASSRLANIGMTETETSRLRETAQETARAMSRKSWPASSWMKTTGTNTAMVVSVPRTWPFWSWCGPPVRSPLMADQLVLPLLR